MATTTFGGSGGGGVRRFVILREKAAKTGNPYFFEWMQELPDEDQREGRKFETRVSEQSGKTRHYELFKILDGYVTGLAIVPNEHLEQDELKINLFDSGETYEINFGEIAGRYSMDVLKKMLDPHFSPLLKFRVSPYAMDGDDGKQRIGISAHSGVDKLEGKKESPGLAGIAQPTTYDVWEKGQKKQKWDWYPVAYWLRDQVNLRVVPYLITDTSKFQTTPQSAERQPAPQQPAKPAPAFGSGQVPPVINTNIRASAAANDLPHYANVQPAERQPQTPMPSEIDDLPF